MCCELSELGRFDLGEEQSESFFAFHSFLAELVIGAEASRMSVEGV